MSRVSLARQAARIGALLLAGGLWLLSCTAAGPEASQGELQITLLPSPDGMAADTMAVYVTDAAGAPVTDAVVSLEGNMNHAGMVPVFTDGVRDEADGAADGVYQAPFAFTMLGDWIITVTVEQADGATVTRDVEVQVSESAVEVEGGPVGRLRVLEARARPAPVAGGTGAAFLTLFNGSDDEERLLGASSPAAATVELHETINDNGVMRMRPQPEGFVIPPRGVLRLAPGGKHLMLMGLAAPLAAGDTVELTLQFAQAGEQVIQVPVMAMGEMATGEAATETMPPPAHDPDAKPTPEHETPPASGEAGDAGSHDHDHGAAATPTPAAETPGQ